MSRAVKRLFRPHYFSWSEQQRIEAAAPLYLRNVVRVISETGLRIYEALAPMQKDHVDLENKVIWISDSKTPNGVADDTAAACALVALTAHLGLVRDAKLRAGETLFVNGGTGGIGSMVVQMTKALDARAITTAGSDEKCALATEHGAAHVINYNKEDFAARVKEITGGRGVKAVYDSVGKDTLQASLDSLQPRGVPGPVGREHGEGGGLLPRDLGARCRCPGPLRDEQRDGEDEGKQTRERRHGGRRIVSSRAGPCGDPAAQGVRNVHAGRPADPPGGGVRTGPGLALGAEGPEDWG